jgi:hypothetical protein
MDSRTCGLQSARGGASGCPQRLGAPRPIRSEAYARRSTLPTGSTTTKIFSFLGIQNARRGACGRRRERACLPCSRLGSESERRRENNLVVGPVGAVERGACGSCGRESPRSKRLRATARSKVRALCSGARGCPQPRQRPQAGSRQQRARVLVRPVSTRIRAVAISAEIKLGSGSTRWRSNGSRTRVSAAIDIARRS